MKWPGPMRVCFCGDTDSKSVVAETTSPTRRYRTISNSEFEASVPTKPGLVEHVEHLRRRRRPTGEPPRSAIPVIRGVAIVHVCNISGGATISPKRERAAASGSVYTGFRSSNAAAQCRIIGRFTGSGASLGPGVADRLADERAEPVVKGPLRHDNGS